MSDQQQYYYKVVYNDDGKLLSGGVFGIEKLQVEYVIGEFVKSHIKGSGLFVFEDLVSARHYVWTEQHVIYKVEVKGISKKILITDTFNKIIPFWRNKRNKQRYTHLLGDSPPGTIMVNEVKLIEKVKLVNATHIY